MKLTATRTINLCLAVRDRTLTPTSRCVQSRPTVVFPRRCDCIIQGFIAFVLMAACVSASAIADGEAPDNGAKPVVASTSASTVTGIVFFDANGDGRRDGNEKLLPDVRVSNGRDVVKTDKTGRYTLPIDDDDIIFVIKPRDYATPIDKLNLPRFYYVHKPAGSPRKLIYRGVAPTGLLPDSVDFPLTSRLEPDTFDVVLFGDPQSRDKREVNYLAHDIVEELIGTDAAFGVTLGDVVYDDLDVFSPQNAVIGTIGIPWYNVHGNHDENYNVKTDDLADETWERVFGPTTYSFDYGPVHFIVLDNVMYDGHIKYGKYHSELGRHLTFIENDLRYVAKDQLVVLLMHIPMIEIVDKDKLFALLEGRQFVFSISAHYHAQMQYSPTTTQPAHGRLPHHHLVHATACGSWWAGTPDERGIPHTTMRDGAPNGYSIVTFKGNQYTIRFKAASRPVGDQIAIFAPDSVTTKQLAETKVYMNVYTGSDLTKVEMRVGKEGAWTTAKHVAAPDPFYAAIKAAEDRPLIRRGRKLRDPMDSPHIWIATLPANLTPGAHVIYVRTMDPYYGELLGKRIIRIDKPRQFFSNKTGIPSSAPAE